VQACQVAHAALRFALSRPEIARAWQRESETIAVLAAPDELALGRLRADAAGAGLHVVAFHEPDLGGALTALALEPSARPLVRRLPTALPRASTSSAREEVTP
jgi:peptidyl-tRNA hydrolase